MIDKVDKVLQKKMMNDWREEFHEFKLYTPVKLFKVVGPLVMGIEMQNLLGNEEYRPHLSCYGLWGEGLNDSLKCPAVYVEHHNRKGLQFNIEYRVHIASSGMPEFGEMLREQVSVPFVGDVTLAQLHLELDKYIERYKVSYPIIMDAMGMKVKSALYVGEDKMAEELYNHLVAFTRDWYHPYDEHFPERRKAWLAAIQNTLDHRDDFMRIIEENLMHPKIAKLNKAALVK
jgi:hypothetical protein